MQAGEEEGVGGRRRSEEGGGREGGRCEEGQSRTITGVRTKQNHHRSPITIFLATRCVTRGVGNAK